MDAMQCEAAEKSGLTSELIDQANSICETVKDAHGVWLGISRVAFLLKELQAEPANECNTQENHSGDNRMTPGQFFRWGLKNVGLVRDIGETAEKVSLAKTNVERWEIIKPLGDKLAPAVDELTGGVVAFSENETAKLRTELVAALKADAKQCAAQSGQAEAAAWGDGKWIERIEKALKLIELLMPLLGRFA